MVIAPAGRWPTPSPTTRTRRSSTVLDRLVTKELLDRRQDGRVIHYSATNTRAVHTALLMREALDATRDPDAALACFAQGLTGAHVEALRIALDDRRS